MDLQMLGEARRTTGQKDGVWTPEKNRKMMLKMDQDGDGKATATSILSPALGTPTNVYI